MSDRIGAYIVGTGQDPTATGERIDRIAGDVFGDDEPGTMEALLEANPRLARFGLVVPEGVAVNVPPAPEQPEAISVLPWL